MLIFDSHCRQIDSLPPDRKCVILNSRQSKRPCNRDDWVTATARAVDGVIRQGLTVITSTGLNTWELTAHLVNIGRGQQIVVLPSMGTVEKPRSCYCEESGWERGGRSDDDEAICAPTSEERKSRLLRRAPHPTSPLRTPRNDTVRTFHQSQP